MSRRRRLSSVATVAFGVSLLLSLTACSTRASPDDYIAADECPVSIPTVGTPTGQHTPGSYHHAGDLWVTGPPDGVLELIGPEDGGLPGTKLVWYRPERGAPLTVTGRRLDGPSGPLVASIPEGYAGHLQATGVNLPEPGCWEITGRSAGETLTFVARMEIRTP